MRVIPDLSGMLVALSAVHHFVWSVSLHLPGVHPLSRQHGLLVSHPALVRHVHRIAKGAPLCVSVTLQLPGLCIALLGEHGLEQMSTCFDRHFHRLVRKHGFAECQPAHCQCSGHGGMHNQLPRQIQTGSCSHCPWSPAADAPLRPFWAEVLGPWR